MRNARVDPDRVLVTQHAVHRYVLRYPGAVLPIHPEKELHALLRCARPMNPNRARHFRHSLRRNTLILTHNRWVFPLTPCSPDRHGQQWDWVLPTVMRDEPHANVATPFQRQRLEDWLAFRNGRADELLLRLVRDTATTDVHVLRREWRARGYPSVLNGGYPTFEEFYRSRIKLLRREQPLAAGV